MILNGTDSGAYLKNCPNICDLSGLGKFPDRSNIEAVNTADVLLY
jgi:hypothetical protein